MDSMVVLNDQERQQVIVTLKDFSSIAKSGTLNNLFLNSYAELVQAKQNGQIEPIKLLLQLDVLIALMEKIRLNRDNYVTLMQSLKVFVEDKLTEKRGYKILIKVI